MQQKLHASRYYAELYPNRRHPSAQQVINVKRRARRNTLHCQRQINRFPNNYDFIPRNFGHGPF